VAAEQARERNEHESGYHAVVGVDASRLPIATTSRNGANPVARAQAPRLLGSCAMRIAALLAVVGCGHDPASVPTDAAPEVDAMTEAGFTPLFDGRTLAGWQMAGAGKFVAADGNLSALPGCDGLGLLWSTLPTPPDFVLRLQWRATAGDDNSGVFVRFPDPNSKGYDNTAWVGVNFGLEIQIDDRGEPDGAPMHTTGSIYDQPDQQFSRVPSRPIGEWNDYEIRARGQLYTVSLNGMQTTRFSFAGDATYPDRALPSAPGAPRYIGLQAHTGFVSFRDIRIAPL
jgi:hypothetical protein